MPRMAGFPQRPAGYSMCWRVSTAPSEPRSDRSTGVSRPGTGRARRAGGWKRYQASVRSSPLPSVAEIGDWKAFGSGRNLAAWIGLVPKQQSTGGKDKLGRITKQGNRYLRWLLVAGAMAVIRYAQKHGTLKRPWLGRLMERRPTKLAAVALANKMARIAWAIIVHGDRYRETKPLLAA